MPTAMGEDTVAAVEPAVGSPDEGVQRLVRVLVAPAVEQYLRRAVGPVVAIRVGDEQQVRGGADPDAAEADLQAADEIEALGEDRPLVEAAVAVGVLEDQDPVLARSSATRTGSSTPRRPRGGRGRRWQMAIGWRTSGSPANRVTLNPSGTFMPARPPRGRGPAGEDVGRGGAGPGREGGLGLVEAEVVEVDVPPAPGVFVDEADDDLLAGCSVRSTATRFRSSVASPEARKRTTCVSSRTTSTRVWGWGPPPTRKLA